MELDPKPDENLIANIPTPRPLFPLSRHTLSQDSVLCLEGASIFSLCDGPAFAEVDYVLCFPDDIFRGLSLPWCLWAVGRTGWVYQREARHIPVLWERRDRAGVQEGSTH